MIREILRMGDPRLLTVANPVTEFGTPELRELVSDMFDTMQAAHGAGLAAPQIAVPLRVVVFGYSDPSLRNPRYPDAPSVPLMVLVNPIVTPLTDEMEEGWEGCLSVPDMRGMVPRHTAIRIEAYDREGTRIDGVVKEFFARVIQHETDHLHGRVYLDRMRDFSTLTHRAEWNKYWLGIQEQDD